jgi:hypothetical protein
MLNFLHNEFHKILIACIFLERLSEHLGPFYARIQKWKGINKLEKEVVKVNPTEILAALQLAPELLPMAVQILTDSNKVLADFNAFIVKLKGVTGGTAPVSPTPAAPVS